MSNINPDMIYLAAPYSHSDPKVREARFHAVTKVAAELFIRGHHVFSPVTHCYPMAQVKSLPGSWEFWASYCRRTLTQCEAVYLLTLPGWDLSPGVAAEMGIADENKIPVTMLKPSEFLTVAEIEACRNPKEVAVSECLVKAATAALDGIMGDISGRRGIGDELEQIDDDIREEMKSTHLEIFIRNLEPAQKAFNEAREIIEDFADLKHVLHYEPERAARAQAWLASNPKAKHENDNSSPVPG